MFSKKPIAYYANLSRRAMRTKNFVKLMWELKSLNLKLKIASNISKPVMMENSFNYTLYPHATAGKMS